MNYCPRAQASLIEESSIKFTNIIKFSYRFPSLINAYGIKSVARRLWIWPQGERYDKVNKAQQDKQSLLMHVLVALYSSQTLTFA